MLKNHIYEENMMKNLFSNWNDFLVIKRFLFLSVMIAGDRQCVNLPPFFGAVPIDTSQDSELQFQPIQIFLQNKKKILQKKLVIFIYW